MKKRFCTIVAFALMLCMLLSVVSCSKDSGSEESKSTVDMNSISSNAEYKVPEGVDYNGKDVTIATYAYDSPWYLCDFNMTIKEDEGTAIGQSIVQRNVVVEQELGVNIELYALEKGDRGNSQKLQNSLMTGESHFDFALPMATSIAPMLASQGMLVDLQTVETMDLSHSWWNQNANFEYTIYGKQYAAVGDICYYNLGAPIATYFNKTMVSENKLEDPYELAEKGEWTLEKVTEMSRQVSKDTNGNGYVDDDDTFGFAGEQESLIYLLFASDVRFTGRDADANVVPTLYNNKSDTAAGMILSLIADNRIARSMNINITSGKAYTDSFHSEYAMPKMADNELLFMSFQLVGSLNMVQQGIEFGVVPSPKYDKSQEEYTTYGNSWFSDHVIIPSICPDVDMVGYVIESMGYYAQQYITPAVIEQSVTLRGATDEVSAKWMNQIIDSQMFDVGYIFNWGDVVGTVCKQVATGQRTFANNWRAIETKFLNELANSVANFTS